MNRIARHPRRLRWPVVIVLGLASGSVAPAQQVRLRSTLKGHDGAVLSLAFSPGGKLLAAGGQTGSVKLWDVSNGKLKVTVRDASSRVVFSPGGKLLASASDDNTVKLWEVGTGKEETTFKGHKEEVTGLAFSPDGTKGRPRPNG
jgi:WD40 repeat protein